MNRITKTGELFSTYLARIQGVLSTRSFGECSRLIGSFLADIGDVPIDSLIPDDLESWIERHAEWRSDWTRARVAATLKTPFNWARRKGLIAINPFDAVSFSPGPRGQPIFDVDLRAIIVESDAVFRRVVYFLDWTSCRPCELSALQWPFVDLERGVAVLAHHKTAKTRRDRMPRVIYLPAKAIRLLKWIRRRWPMERFVFLNSMMRPWNRSSLTLRVYRIRKRFGLPKEARLYGIRHATATRLAASGVEMAMLATILGHTTVTMSAHYIHLAGQTDRVRAALEKGLGGK